MSVRWSVFSLVRPLACPLDRLSLDPSVGLSVGPSFRWFILHWSIRSSSVGPSVAPFVGPSVGASVGLSVGPSDGLSVSASVGASVRLFRPD